MPLWWGLWLDYDCGGDGYLFPYPDCDDFDPTINPGAQELRYDNVDSNCNGQIDF